MKRRIDLERAAEAEVFGALALRGGDEKNRQAGRAKGSFTEAQIRAVSDQARSLFEFALKAGAQNDRIVVGDVALKLGKSGAELAVELKGN